MKRLRLSHEGTDYQLSQREFDEFHGLTVATITMNEEEYRKQKLEILKEKNETLKNIHTSITSIEESLNKIAFG